MKNLIIFALFLLLGFGLGYLFFEAGEDNQQATEEQTVQPNDAAKEEAHNDDAPEAEPMTAEGQVLTDQGCLSCHAVSALNLQGGATGPDLSQAYVNVEGKHGKPIDEFLKEPTSAVMSTVIQGSPLSDEERTQIVEALRVASEQ